MNLANPRGKVVLIDLKHFYQPIHAWTETVIKQNFNFNPIAHMDALAGETPARCAFLSTDARQARTWQKRARRALKECVGFMDTPRVDLKPRIIERVDRGAYVRQKVVIRTGERCDMPMYLLIPHDTPRPLRCILALHGHGYGVKEIVGLWEDGAERQTPSGYHKDFGCVLAERGFLVAAPEISCFGERRMPEDTLDPNASSCTRIATYAFMLGGSAVGLRVRDGMRAIDYLETLDEADSSTIGAMGISGGGMHAFFSTAIDPRIKACVISGYFCDWRHSILGVPHCACNFVPGILQLGQLSDLAGLIAPRPCLIENADHDDIFPIKHVKQTVRRARRSWAAFGAERLLETDYFEGRHEISGAKAYDFLARHLTEQPT